MNQRNYYEKDSLRKIVVYPETSIREVIKIIDNSGMQIALVADSNGIFLGTITDGDIRRAVLKGISIEALAREIMNSSPITASHSSTRDSIISIMQTRKIRQLPIISENGILDGLAVLEDLLGRPNLDNPVILMAGGLGTRLQPLTNACPKPLLKVGGKPILETTIERFVEQGFKNFYLSVHYMAGMIEQYFGDGNKWGIEIKYLKEASKLGTAGALSLLPEFPTHPIIVMNGDLLTKVNFNSLLDFHSEHDSVATMCVREYDFEVPYGVVMADNYRLVSIDEKPVHQFSVNAGIYVLNPETVRLIPSDTNLDMPALFERLLSMNKKAVVFPVTEYWIDIGKVSDYERANVEFHEVFGFPA